MRAKKMSMLWTPKPNEMPYIDGSTEWEYVKKHRGIMKLFKRPRIRYLHGFTYWHRGKYPIVVPKGDVSDTHSIPWPFVFASLGIFFDFVMKYITWPSGVHDEACEKMLWTRQMRADIYHESVWLAGLKLKEHIEETENGWFREKFLVSAASVRNLLLVAGVKSASAVGAAC